MKNHSVSPQPSSSDALINSLDCSSSHAQIRSQPFRFWLALRLNLRLKSRFTARFTARFTEWGEKLLDKLSRSPEPQVTFRRDRQGNHYWEVFDPATGQTALLDSTPAVRMWLEQRYHRP
jgi:hypothetical protein